ncbi:hypothetical protein M8J73_43605, partial [Streptomyces neyagawaensis]|nr:hypothetical protein [Streptomyces neyagawaensis]
MHRRAWRRSRAARTGSTLVAAGLALLGTLGATPGSPVSPPGQGPAPGAPPRFVPAPCPDTPEPIPGR